MSSSSSVKVVSERVLRILRSLYDLKQVARDWHERCIVELLKLRFQQCVVDSCLLIHYERQIMLLIYVNDITIVVKAIFEVIWFKNDFKKMFKIKNSKKMKKILEIRIIRDRQRRTLRMNETHYFKKIIDRLYMRREDKHKLKVLTFLWTNTSLCVLRDLMMSIQINWSINKQLKIWCTSLFILVQISLSHWEDWVNISTIRQYIIVDRISNRRENEY